MAWRHQVWQASSENLWSPLRVLARYWVRVPKTASILEHDNPLMREGESLFVLQILRFFPHHKPHNVAKHPPKDWGITDYDLLSSLLFTVASVTCYFRSRNVSQNTVTSWCRVFRSSELYSLSSPRKFLSARRRETSCATIIMRMITLTYVSYSGVSSNRQKNWAWTPDAFWKVYRNLDFLGLRDPSVTMNQRTFILHKEGRLN